MADIQDYWIKNHHRVFCLLPADLFYNRINLFESENM